MIKTVRGDAEYRKASCEVGGFGTKIEGKYANTGELNIRAICEVIMARR